ncbi:hypothetical protein BKA65DRAFT_474952 [Rhexocercosporidium sp. MPI-PUGE-AT-0058]|nr:hypothetical protein BKA65DRAFT_474952 [Rhexocercosporidium sp. MPI-PUGE-AT-0058]
MVNLDTPLLTDLEIARRGARDAAVAIAQEAAGRAFPPFPVAPRIVPVMASAASSLSTIPESQPLTTFHPFPNLPMELRTLICSYNLPSNRLVKISSDDYTFTTKNELTNEITEVDFFRAMARMWISPLAAVCTDTQRVARASTYITGFRLKYIPLYFDFDNDTLFFEDAAALISLMGPIRTFEPRDHTEEEQIAAAFNRRGPKNVVLAGPVAAYEEIYSVLRHFAWLDTLIMQEPRRSRQTPLARVTQNENEIRAALEDGWEGVRGPNAKLPLVRFLPRQHIEFMVSS